MEIGDAPGAFMCATTLVAYKNAVGSPLNEIMKQCQHMCKCNKAGCDMLNDVSCIFLNV